ncbi:hypothetical protein F5887DRAFT_1137224 [Amanita rubescens]|nr:hypothetical protein F5887DRAFT_1137224 [Amanita rubescens]
MSSLTIIGFFTLSGASRLGTFKSGFKTERFYNHYMSGIQGRDEENPFPVEIRVYSPSPHDTIANEKIALVIGPIAFTKQQAYIEASTRRPRPCLQLFLLHMMKCNMNYKVMYT